MLRLLMQVDDFKIPRSWRGTLMQTVRKQGQTREDPPMHLTTSERGDAGLSSQVELHLLRWKTIPGVPVPRH